MKNFSKEIIEINGTEYSLFLNREGIVAFEKYSRNESKKLQEIAKKLNEKAKTSVAFEVKDDANPFEDKEILENEELINETANAQSNLYKRLYWIMMYTDQKLTISEVNDLYDKACEEYGEEQIIALADQIVEDANSNKVNKDELKKLPALRPRK